MSDPRSAEAEVEEHRRRLRRDVVWNLAPVVLLGVVGLGLNFLIGGWWGPSALGAFNLVTTGFMALAVLGAGGLQFAVLRAIAEEPEDRARVAAVVVGALIPNVVFAAIATAVFVAIRHPLGALLDSEPVAIGMLWAAPGLFCFAINKVLLGVVNGQRRMRAFAVYTCLRYTLIAVGLLVARAIAMPADQLPVIWTFAEGGLLLVLIGELLVTVKFGDSGGWRTWMKRHIDYGARSVLSTLAYEVNSKLDVWMLGVALPDAQVGVYSLASALFEGVMQLAIVVQNNLNPLLARNLAAHRPAEVVAIVRRARRWFVPLMVSCCALGAALYPVVIPWVIGNAAFAEGTIPFAIMMAGVALASPYLPFAQLLLMASRPGWHTVYVLLTVVVAFVVNLALIPTLGLAGAATATASGVIASAVLLRVMVRFRLEIRI